MDMREETRLLWENLKELHKNLRDFTMNKYNRINPFYEDLFSWKERGEYWLGEDKGVTIYNSATVVGDVSIGESTWIGPFCSLDGTGGLSIGSYCSISAGCQLITHDSVKWALSGGKSKYEYESIHIGDCCFLGSRVIVVKGVTVGNHSLVGAGAVVTKDVPDYSIVAGVPARRVGRVHLDGNEQVEFKYDNRRL